MSKNLIFFEISTIFRKHVILSVYYRPSEGRIFFIRKIYVFFRNSVIYYTGAFIYRSPYIQRMNRRLSWHTDPVAMVLLYFPDDKRVKDEKTKRLGVA